MLAQLLLIISIGVLVYVICIALDQKLVGYLVVLLAFLTAVSLIAQEVTPIIKDMQEKKQKVEKFIEKLP